jgi:hypothetical protein
VYTMIYHTSDRRPLHRVLDVGTTCGREVAPSGKPQEYTACCAALNTQSLYHTVWIALIRVRDVTRSDIRKE